MNDIVCSTCAGPRSCGQVDALDRHAARREQRVELAVGGGVGAVAAARDQRAGVEEQQIAAVGGRVALEVGDDRHAGRLQRVRGGLPLGLPGRLRRAQHDRAVADRERRVVHVAGVDEALHGRARRRRRSRGRRAARRTRRAGAAAAAGRAAPAGAGEVAARRRRPHEHAPQPRDVGRHAVGGLDLARSWREGSHTEGDEGEARPSARGTASDHAVEALVLAPQREHPEQREDHEAEPREPEPGARCRRAAPRSRARRCSTTIGAVRVRISAAISPEVGADRDRADGEAEVVVVEERDPDARARRRPGSAGCRAGSAPRLQPRSSAACVAYASPVRHHRYAWKPTRASGSSSTGSSRQRSRHEMPPAGVRGTPARRSRAPA